MAYTDDRPFGPEDEERVEQAIAEAERMTSGEIRIHLEKHCPEDALVRARRIFQALEMYKTKDRNGVLLYVALVDHKLAVFGDEDIHATVGVNYWSDVVDHIVSHFRDGDIPAGLVAGILRIGEILKKYYPYESDDRNELDNSISYSAPLPDRDHE